MIMKQLSEGQQRVYKAIKENSIDGVYSLGAKRLSEQSGIALNTVNRCIRSMLSDGTITKLGYTVFSQSRIDGSARGGTRGYARLSINNYNLDLFQDKPAITTQSQQFPYNIDESAKVLADATANHIKLLYEQQRTIEELRLQLSQVKEDALVKLQREMKELTDRVQAW